MQKDEIFDLVVQYRPYNAEESASKEETIAFLRENEIVFGKANPNGHLTGSTWVVNKTRDKVLLTHHKKLGKWLQLGGHTEEGENISETSIREALEESGLPVMNFVIPGIFDIHIGKVPEWKTEKAHKHYDIRFILEADDRLDVIASDESHDVKWIPFNRIEEYDIGDTILRMMEKTLKYFNAE